ncbi:MAG: phage portal protein [Acidaminococcaceae bacterium]|nr:phage portal protein [Acidaminococcaceae bacterium]
MIKKKRTQNARQPTKAGRPFIKTMGRLPLNVVDTGYSEGGASRTKSAMRGYNPIKASTKSDVDVNLPILRNRSNDMFCNSPLGASAINTSRTNVIGAGLRISPKINYRILGLNPEEAKTWQRKTVSEFNLWAESAACDLYRKNNFFDMQDMAYMAYLVDGDAWAAIKYRKPLPNNPYCLRVQLFEASRVSNPDSFSGFGTSPYYLIETKNTKNGNRIINGVEINDDGAVVAYWIANRVPYDPTDLAGTLKWSRVEAFGRQTGMPNVLQISHEERAEQYRGVPYLAPVLENLKQIHRYTNAELTAAIIKAFFTLFFTEQNGNGDLDNVLNQAFTEQEHDRLTPEDMNFFELGPGTLNLLPAGYDVKAVDASRNLSTFEPFTNVLVSQIGAALGIPSEVMLSKFQSSYSAARGALMQAMAVFKTRRTWFARDFCQPVYEAWLAEAVAIGRIKAHGFGTDPLITKAWCGADWFGPVMGMLDPVKEVNGAALRVKYGFSTGEREAAEITGTDYDNNIDQIAIEHGTWLAKGMTPPKADKTGEEGGDENAKE